MQTIEVPINDYSINKIGRTIKQCVKLIIFYSFFTIIQVN